MNERKGATSVWFVEHSIQNHVKSDFFFVALRLKMIRFFLFRWFCSYSKRIFCVCWGECEEQCAAVFVFLCVNDNKSNPVYNETKLNNKKKSKNKFTKHWSQSSKKRKGRIVLLCKTNKFNAFSTIENILLRIFSTISLANAVVLVYMCACVLYTIRCVVWDISCAQIP